MSISIVIITYNSSEKIVPLLKSISLQRDKSNIEVIIVDNNSPDRNELKKRIENYCKNCKLNVIAKYRKSNPGFGASCNYGASLSNNENILFLNPDTKLFPKSISILCDHSESSHADICGGKSIKFDSKEMHRTVFNTPGVKTMLFEFSNLGKIFNVSGNFYSDQENDLEDLSVGGIGGAYFLIKKSSFNKLHGFDENIFMYLEDVDICVRAREFGMRIVYCPHSVIEHIGGASTNNKYKIVHKAWYDSREYYAKKHFSIITSSILLIIYKVEKLILEFRQSLQRS